MNYSNEKDIHEFQKVNTDSWDGLKDNVYLRLINAKFLSKYGDDIAHSNFLDLAITYSVQEKDGDTFRSHMLTNQDLIDLDISLDSVKATAMKNSYSDRKRRLLKFSENMLKEHLMYPIAVIPEGINMGVGPHGSTLGIIKEESDGLENLIVITNKIAFGSSCIALPQVLEEVYSRFNNENFYILPMSIHQSWCVRISYATHNGEKTVREAEDDLLDMVESFNDKENKTWQDILSYKIYYYLGDDGKRLFPIK